jgi:DNA (cytosine-5)-methyltransferase 1
VRLTISGVLLSVVLNQMFARAVSGKLPESGTRRAGPVDGIGFAGMIGLSPVTKVMSNVMANPKSAFAGLRELALFAGVGGGILGGKLLGWQTVCAVEIEEYPRRVLAQRQEDGVLPPFPVWGDITTFEAKVWRGAVDVVSGGFPCQDISVAGKGAGITGKRSGLWEEMARVVREVRPRFIAVENSPALASRGLHRVLGSLAQIGSDAEWGVFGAVDVGAPHRRYRMWILADTNR